MKATDADEMILTLNSPITEEQWDALTDVDFDNTDEIYFRTKHGKEVYFVKRKKGEWISKGYGEYRCSSCREIVDLDEEILMSIKNFDYCPYCGSYNGGNTET